MADKSTPSQRTGTVKVSDEKGKEKGKSSNLKNESQSND